MLLARQSIRPRPAVEPALAAQPAEVDVGQFHLRDRVRSPRRIEADTRVHELLGRERRQPPVEAEDGGVVRSCSIWHRHEQRPAGFTSMGDERSHTLARPCACPCRARFRAARPDARGARHRTSRPSLSARGAADDSPRRTARLDRAKPAGLHEPWPCTRATSPASLASPSYPSPGHDRPREALVSSSSRPGHGRRGTLMARSRAPPRPRPVSAPIASRQKAVRVTPTPVPRPDGGYVPATDRAPGRVRVDQLDRVHGDHCGPPAASQVLRSPSLASPRWPLQALAQERGQSAHQSRRRPALVGVGREAQAPWRDRSCAPVDEPGQPPSRARPGSPAAVANRCRIGPPHSLQHPRQRARRVRAK